METNSNNNNILSLRSILEKDKLIGPNFMDWERNLRMVLRHERKWYVLEEPLGQVPPAGAPTAIRNTHQKDTNDLLEVGCQMLATMSPNKINNYLFINLCFKLISVLFNKMP